MIPGTCVLCGCSEHAACFGGLLITRDSVNAHRLVGDERTLPRGTTCFWLDEDETLCSAHLPEELRAAGAGPAELQTRQLGLLWLQAAAVAHSGDSR